MRRRLLVGLVCVVTISLCSGSPVFSGEGKIDKTKTYPHGTGKDLQALKAEDVKVMQIFRLRLDGRTGTRKKAYARSPLQEDMVRSFLALCKAAQAARPPRGRARTRPVSPSHTMVVRLATGRTFEIPYNGDLDQPFGGLGSRPLKQALRATVRGSRISIIHFHEGKVIGVIHFDVPEAGAGSRASQTVSTSMRLDEQGRLVLALKTWKDRKLLVDGTRNVQYGQATTFPHKEVGHMIVLLHPE